MKKLSGKQIALIVVAAIVLIVILIVVGNSLYRSKAVKEIKVAFSAFADNRVEQLLEDSKRFNEDYILKSVDYEIQQITYEKGIYTIWLDIYAECDPSPEWEQETIRLKWEAVCESAAWDIEEYFEIEEDKTIYKSYEIRHYFEMAGYKCSYSLPLLSKYTPEDTTSTYNRFYTYINDELVKAPKILSINDSSSAAATCPNCGTGFRKDSVGARMIQKHGYCNICNGR